MYNDGIGLGIIEEQMPIRHYREGKELITSHIPKSVMREVRILLLDPTTGRIKYGELSNLVTGLLTEWLESKRKNQDTITTRTPPKDRFEEFSNEGN